MRTAINNFQKTLFTILLFVSGYSGIISNLALGNNKGGFYLAFDALILILALMCLSYIKGRLAVVLLFIIGCIIFNYTYNGNSLYYSLNGTREILNLLCLSVFFSFVFREENEELAQEYIEIMKKFAASFLVLQIPVAIYQFLQHGPSDYVGGTYGSFGSGILTLSITCLIFFLSHFTRNLTQRVLLYCCLLPLLLNETKVSFIIIPLLVIFIHFKPKLKSIVGAGLAAFLFLFIFNQYYSNNFGTDFDNNITGIFSKDFIDNYLFGDIYMYTDVPRFTKIIMAWNLLLDNTITFLFGFEYGIFRAGDDGDMSQFAQSVQWLMTGTRPYLFFLLIQGGLLLFVGVMWLILYINRFFTKYNNKYKTFLFLLFVMILFYNDALRNQNFSIIFFFSMFYANSVLYNQQLEEE